MPAAPIYTEDTKREAMVLYARGNSLRAIGRELDVPNVTVGEWKRKCEPADWDDFKRKYVNEALQIALQEIRVEAAEQMAEHFADTIKQRDVIRRAMNLMDLKLRRFEKLAQDDGQLPDDVAMLRLFDSIRKMVAASGLLQLQQRDSLGLPKVAALEVMQDGDGASGYTPEQLDKIARENPEQLLQIALARVEGAKQSKDVTPKS